MNTFSERESYEQLAWTKFEAWLKNGNWSYHRFRYPKDLTIINIHDPKIKEELKKVDFDHDGIMARPFPNPVETWLFDLKYKTEDFDKILVNVEDYDAYFSLSNVIPYLIIVYIRENDRLYFHRVRDPQKEPKPYKYWDSRPAQAGGQKYVYQMPEEEYCLISGFDIPFELPRSEIDYRVKCKMMEDQFLAWKNEKSFTPRPYEEYKKEVLLELEKGFPEAWKDVPKFIKYTEKSEGKRKRKHLSQ